MTGTIQNGCHEPLNMLEHMNQDVKSFFDELKQLISEERDMHNQISSLTKELDNNERKKAVLAYMLHKEFVNRNAGNLSAETDYYYIYLNSRGNNDVTVLPVRYIDEHCPESAKTYARFKPISGGNLRINLEYDLAQDDYASAKAIIDRNQLEQLKPHLSIAWLDQ